MNKLRKQLLKAAKQKGLCDTGKDIIRHAPDLETMMQQYHDHIGWHIVHDNPPKEVLREHFAGFSNNWVAIDTKATFVDEEKVFLAIAANGEVQYGNNKRGRVYMRQDAALNLNAGQGAFVTVSAYDNATVRVRPADTARVYVFLHDNARMVDTPDFPKQIIIKKA